MDCRTLIQCNLTALQFLKKYQFIKKSGASYSYLPPGGDASTEVKLGRGYDAARTTLREDAKLQKELLIHIKKSLKEDAKKTTAAE